MSEPSRALWLLPMLLMISIPSLHRFLVPTEYYEMYTSGNWFRACFLYVFTWLALSFIIANPPLADIAAPALADGLDIEETEGVETIKWKNGELMIELNQNEIDVVLGMGIRDNIDVESATITASIWYRGELLKDSDGNIIGNLTGGTVEVGTLTDAMATFDEVNGSWSRGQLRHTLTKQDIGPRVAPQTTDYGLAWNLGQLGPGEYEVRIALEEGGAPWKGGVNTWSADYILNISQVA